MRRLSSRSLRHSHGARETLLGCTSVRRRRGRVIRAWRRPRTWAVEQRSQPRPRLRRRQAEPSTASKGRRSALAWRLPQALGPNTWKGSVPRHWPPPKRDHPIWVWAWASSAWHPPSRAIERGNYTPANWRAWKYSAPPVWLRPKKRERVLLVEHGG